MYQKRLEIKIEDGEFYQKAISPEEFITNLKYEIDKKEEPYKARKLSFFDIFENKRYQELIQNQIQFQSPGLDFIKNSYPSFGYILQGDQDLTIPNKDFAVSSFSCFYQPIGSVGFFTWDFDRTWIKKNQTQNFKSLISLNMQPYFQNFSYDEIAAWFDFNYRYSEKEYNQNVLGSVLYGQIATFIYDDFDVSKLSYFGQIVSPKPGWFKLDREKIINLIRCVDQAERSREIFFLGIKLDSGSCRKLVEMVYQMSAVGSLPESDKRNIMNGLLFSQVVDEDIVEQLVVQKICPVENAFCYQNLSEDFFDKYFSENYFDIFYEMMSKFRRVPLSAIEKNLPLFAKYKRHLIKNTRFSKAEVRKIKKLIDALALII